MTENTEADAIMALADEMKHADKMLTICGDSMFSIHGERFDNARAALRAAVEQVCRERDELNRISREQTETIVELEDRTDAAIALLKEARGWLTDPRLDTWTYMEGGGFYTDKREWIARIDAVLK